MKIRTDYVTNSSSSSFICVAKVNKTDELMEFMKEEYGKYGVSLMDKLVVTGKRMKEDINVTWRYEEYLDYCKENGIQIDDTTLFLSAMFYIFDSEGDGNKDDAWLYKHIPDKYIEEIYKGESD